MAAGSLVAHTCMYDRRIEMEVLTQIIGGLCGRAAFRDFCHGVSILPQRVEGVARYHETRGTSVFGQAGRWRSSAEA